MFPASCILLCLAAPTHQLVLTYVKPWDPFRRSLQVTECEMCYKGSCVPTRGPRCEYYAEASKLICDDDVDDKVEHEIQRDDNKIDSMLFQLVDSASASTQFKGCVPLVSRYTDCTEENICIGCKSCSCDEAGRWTCSETQKCRAEPKLSIDHRVVGIVIENLKRKEKAQERRVKRSDGNTKIKDVKDKVTYTDLSKWMYGVEPQNYEQKSINIGEILEYLKSNVTTLSEYRNSDQTAFATLAQNGSSYSTTTSSNKDDSYIDFLEFNDILQSWTIDDLSTKEPFVETDIQHRSKEIYTNDVDYIEYDPIRLIKRDTSQLQKNENSAILKINNTRSNFTYALILTDALQGLNKITNEKQKELEELLNIQNNLLSIAKAYNIVIDMNSTLTRDNYNKHHIAIYKLNTFEKCVAKVKHDICNIIENVIKTDVAASSSNLQHDLKLFFNVIKKYILLENNKTIDREANILSSHERYQNSRRHITTDNRYQIANPTKDISNILLEINKAPANPVQTLSKHLQKILKRIIKQLYLDDFAVIDYVIHETYYDFDSYLENIGIRWNKMTKDVIESKVFDTFYRMKLLHMILKADISKMEDLITLLEFARNRRMTVANGVTIDKSILRIQNNLQLIDNNVQKIMKLEKDKKMRQASAIDSSKSVKKKSVLQKLKKMFQSSKNDIKEMLRKRFPKSEIMKQIAKKKLDGLERRRISQYQEAIKPWEENLNVVPERKKRFAWGFQAFASRIKSIIPGYLRGKVMQKKKGNNTHTHRIRERKKKTSTKQATTNITTVSRRPAEP